MKVVLAERSSKAAIAALGAFFEGDQIGYLMQAAISLELLGKAVLCSIHPSLIIDKDFDSLLTVCGAARHSKTPPWRIKTVGAYEVLERCGRIVPRLGQLQPKLRLLAELRNAAVHIGDMDEPSLADTLDAFLQGSGLLLGELDKKSEEHFGKYAEFVQSRLDEKAEKMEREVVERIARARAAFDRRFGALESAVRTLLIQTVTRTYKLRKYDEQLTECPACGSDGVLSGTVSSEWEIDGPDDASLTVRFRPWSFACGVCGLVLEDSDELLPVGLADEFDLEDVDESDFVDL